ncbi:MAG TPA: hypothetical protein DEA32_01035 [Firmicutes bacterium]|nr:hypothetical protein [Bacillota bacterium]
MSTLRKVAFAFGILTIISVGVTGLIYFFLAISAVAASGADTDAAVQMTTLWVTAICLLIPLAWMIPMLIHMKKAADLSTGFSICTLLFFNLISGILLLCDDKK